MNEQTQAGTKTGYESIADLGDTIRELIPRGTECAITVGGFSLNTEGGKGKEFINAVWDVVGPEELEDYGSFRQSYYLGNVPKPGKGPKATAFHISRKGWCEVIAAIHGVPYSADDVRFFFADLESDPSADFVAWCDEVVAKLNSLTGQTFTTRIGVEKDKTGQYPDKQTIGKPIYPSEAEYAAEHGNGASA